VVGRTLRLLLGIVVGLAAFVYAIVSAFAGRPLRLDDSWTFAAAVVRATPAHVQGRNPLETLRLGGQAFGSPVKTFTVAARGQTYTLPLPPHTAYAPSQPQTQRFITFATGEELQEYFGSTLREAGWRDGEQLGSRRRFERGQFSLSVDTRFYLGTRIRALTFPAAAGLDRPGPPAPGYPELTLSPALRARLAGLPPAGARPRRIHAPSDLVDAAKNVVAFLRGEIDFNRIRLANSVTLYLGQEAGGVRREVTRAMLRNPRNWNVRLEGVRGHSYSLVPPKGLPVMTTRVGRHFRCRDHPLSTISEDLARFPHVGVLLTPENGGSCLQVWNLTLVFDPKEKPPTLIAVVYDQFEW
jgi:hypothetical protein